MPSDDDTRLTGAALLREAARRARTLPPPMSDVMWWYFAAWKPDTADGEQVQAERAGALLALPSPEVDREQIVVLIESVEYGVGGWVSRTSREHATDIANALISAGVVLTEPLPEWSCPGCGATTRARMADHEGSAGTVSGDVAGDLVDVAAQAIRANHNLDRKVVEFHTDARNVVVAVLRRLAVEIARSEPDSATVLALAGEVEKGENADATL